MENLKLHSEGENDFLQELRKRFDKMELEIKNNEGLTDEEKLQKIKLIRTDFEKAKRNASGNFF